VACRWRSGRRGARRTGGGGADRAGPWCARARRHRTSKGCPPCPM